MLLNDDGGKAVGSEIEHYIVVLLSVHFQCPLDFDPSLLRGLLLSWRASTLRRRRTVSMSTSMCVLVFMLSLHLRAAAAAATQARRIA